MPQFLEKRVPYLDQEDPPGVRVHRYMSVLEVLHRILDARGVTLEAGEWQEIRDAVREERVYAVVRYALDEEKGSNNNE